MTAHALNSDRGARGPMQLMPSTAARYGVSDICNPEQNVRGGLLFLKDLVAQFQGNMMLVAAAYNAGPDRVYRRPRRPGDHRDGPLRRQRRQQILRPERLRGAAKTRRRHAPTGRGAGRVAEAAQSGPAAQHPPQEWIGGSVLYVGDGERR